MNTSGSQDAEGQRECFGESHSKTGLSLSDR